MNIQILDIGNVQQAPGTTVDNPLEDSMSTHGDTGTSNQPGRSADHIEGRLEFQPSARVVEMSVFHVLVKTWDTFLECATR